MDGTYSTADTNGPSLTLDVFFKVYQELEALLPELLYKTHEYVPRTKDGEPFFVAIPKFDWPSGDVTGKHILFLHPDNMALLRLKAKGVFRLVEWRQEEPQP
jgi:hypothetical protein